MRNKIAPADQQDCTEGNTLTNKITMDSKPNQKSVTVQGIGSPVPVQAAGVGAGLTGPLASDCGSSLVAHQARGSTSTTGTKDQEENPFRRRDSIARSPVHRDRTQSCPRVLALGNKSNSRSEKPETEIQRLAREEKLAFEGLGKNIAIIDGIVKDARNIHKQIRDAITGAVIYYQRLRDVREAQVKAREENRDPPNRQEEQDKENDPLKKKTSRETQTKSRLKNTSVQTDPEGERSNLLETKYESKKRGASSPPENLGQGKRTRTKGVSKTPVETGESSERQEKEPEWQEVEHRKHKRKKSEGNVTKRTNRRIRNKLPEAVAVKPKDASYNYADVLKNIKAKVDPTALGVKISKIRQTRSGELLIEIAKGSEKVDELKNAVAEALGEDASVRNMNRSVAVEIRDLDGATDEKEVIDAIKLVAPETDPESIKIRALRKTFGETQMAIITMPATTAEVVLKAGKIRIGWIRCRAREKIPVTRCFQCLGFGHIARDCKGPDRSKLCRLCGNEGHMARECTQKPFCVVCNDGNVLGGAHHILGSAKCGSYQRGIQKTRK